MNFADQEEIALRKKSRSRKRRNDIVWNSLTAIIIIATVGAAGVMVVLFSNPASSLNPFPPPTLPALIQIPTATLTPIITPATSTPTVAASTEAANVEGTPIQTETAPISTATQTPIGDYLFAVKGSPVGMTNTTFHPNMDCNWQGVAGKVTDIQGKAVSNLAIHLTGTYNGKSVDQTTLSGGAAKWIGDGGYEIVLQVGSAPIDSIGLLTIQIEDSSYIPLSAPITFDTYSDCARNLILINFQQMR
jgi:flagellar basal body-associated protein FliL